MLPTRSRSRLTLQASHRPAEGRRLPARALLGVTLVAIAWPLAWFGTGEASRHAFFPLWVGYILTVDGFLFLRHGTSPWCRDRRGFLGLFAISIPLWWVFEAFNARLHNWSYLLPEPY